MALQDGWNRHIKEAWFIYPDNSLIKITRAEIKDRTISKRLP
jgi:hypothetical protein